MIRRALILAFLSVAILPGIGGGLTNRSRTYAYYGAGNPSAGKLQTIVHGRGTTWTYSYDDFLRLASATLNGQPVEVQFDNSDADGRWRTFLDLTPGANTLVATAVHPSGAYTTNVTSVFQVATNAGDTLNNTYDANGNVSVRTWVNSSGTTVRTQTLTRDAFDRIIKWTERDGSNNGFDFVSIYDGLGRRLRTLQTLVTNNVAITTPADAVSTVDSWYDPEVKYLEIGVIANGAACIKTYGPDGNGVYGGMQGIGGLETDTPVGEIPACTAVNDFFGNDLACIEDGVPVWRTTRLSSYGPVPGYPSLSLSANQPLDKATSYLGKRVDPTGMIYFGGRADYDPASGRFLSHDSVFDPANPGGHSFCGGDPVNFVDPDGRFGKAINADLMGGGYNAAHEALLDDIAGPKVTLGGLADGLDYWAEVGANLPLSPIFGFASVINTSLSGENDQGDKVSGWQRGLATAGVLLPFLPVGEILNFGLNGIQAYGEGIAGIYGQLSTYSTTISGFSDVPTIAGIAAEGGIQFGTKGDAFLANASKASPIEGSLDVAVHGDALSVQIGENTVNHRVLSQLIQQNPEFNRQGIRLLSCETGNLPNGFAQNLANKLGVPVQAPNDIIWAFPNGRLTIGPTPAANSGSFIQFLPGGGRP